MEKIWDAVIPFHPLLARDLADQTQIAGSLHAAAAPDSKRRMPSRLRRSEPDQDKAVPASQNQSAGAGQPSLGTETEDLAQLAETQERTQRRTQLLKLKAEAELARLEEQPPPDARKDGQDPGAGKDDPKNAAGRASQNPSIPKRSRLVIRRRSSWRRRRPGRWSSRPKR